MTKRKTTGTAVGLGPRFAPALRGETEYDRAQREWIERAPTDVLQHLYARGLRIIEHSLGDVEMQPDGIVGPVKDRPPNAKLAAFLLDRLGVNPRDVARISRPLPLQRGDLDTIEKCSAVAQHAAVMAMTGEIGLREAERIQKLVETAAKMGWAADLQRSTELRDKLEALAEQRGISTGSEDGLRWGRFSGPVDAAEEVPPVPVEDAKPAPTGYTNGHTAPPDGTEGW
jgi:hypothetical protein